MDIVLKNQTSGDVRHETDNIDIGLVLFVCTGIPLLMRGFIGTFFVMVILIISSIFFVMFATVDQSSRQVNKLIIPFFPYLLLLMVIECGYSYGISKKLLFKLYFDKGFRIVLSNPDDIQYLSAKYGFVPAMFITENSINECMEAKK